jgi:DNA-binding transcriptional MerR regulator
LIETPNEKQGTASVFDYMSLLQLVAIKKLQAEHLPIRKIRELVAGRSEQELESLLGTAGGKSGKESEAKRYLESLLAPTLSKSKAASGRVSEPPRAMAAPAEPAQESQSVSWQRVEIEPGLELHIRSDYTPPMSSAKSRTLADRIRSVIRRHWGGL